MAYQNQKHVLVPAGRWQLIGFSYGKSRCTCCGRPIRRLYHLKNLDHKAKLSQDASYNHPETITIGCVCGPKLFKESCEGFYVDPGREWNRQHAAFKDYINYIILNVQNKSTWQLIPERIRKPIDDYLENGYKHDAHTGPWWRMRDAKKRLLKLKKYSPKNLPSNRALRIETINMINVAKKLGILEFDSNLLPEEFNV